MKAKFAAFLCCLFLLGACSSTEDEMSSSATGGQPDSAGLGSQGGISSSDLGATGIGGVQPGSQADLEVNVGDRVFFGLDSSALDEAARQTLDRQAVWLQQFSNVVVTVEGHTDERGSAEYNLALGERRATEVKDYLVTLGVEPNRIETLSFGKERPADPGHNETAWALNRRAVTVVNVGF